MPLACLLTLPSLTTPCALIALISCVCPVPMAAAYAADSGRPRVLPQLLVSLDANKDGRLTLDELDTAREQQLARFDRDGDGKLSPEEYQALWLDAARERLVRQFR